jgi:hypothetical protein
MRRNAHWFSPFAGFLLGAGLTETLQILSHGYGRYKPSAAHFDTMKQRSFDLNQSTRKTRKQVFLQQMEAVGTWAALVEFMARFYSEGRNARPPSVLQAMLRVRFMQPWSSLSYPVMAEAFSACLTAGSSTRHSNRAFLIRCGGFTSDHASH